MCIKNNENKEKFISLLKKKRSNKWYTAVSEPFNYDYGFSTDDWSNSFNKAWEKLEKSVETLCKQANLK
jgi:hypothetical protein